MSIRKTFSGRKTTRAKKRLGVSFRKKSDRTMSAKKAITRKKSGRTVSAKKSSARKSSTRKKSVRKASGRKASGRKTSGRKTSGRKTSVSEKTVRKSSKGLKHAYSNAARLLLRDLTDADGTGTGVLMVHGRRKAK